MQENYLRQSLALTALVAGLLLLLYIVPPFHAGTLKIKRVNLLADVQRDPVKKQIVFKDTSAKKAVVVPKPVPKPSSCPPGITCLEDYTEDHQSLSKFYRALQSVQNRSVRIAFFGDSFIEGDILCANFRDTLQGLFGGRGVGFVPIASEVAQYRTTIQHTFSQWKTYSIVGAKAATAPFGTSGFCFIPLEGNEVEYKTARKKTSERFHQIRLFYEDTGNAMLHYTVNDTTSADAELTHTDTLQQFIVPEHNVTSVKFSVSNSDSTRVYGASFESGTGLFVDNFSMRGNSGMGLYQIEPKQHQAFNRYRDYKLILLQYGLNVVSETDTAGYAWYVERMTRVVGRIKESFPGACILLISVSDRSSNQDGKFATMPNIPLMVEAQRDIARKCHINFWDMYTAMGGKNSMLKYVAATPSLAAKDYTHLTYWGGRKIAKKLADAILYQRKQHEAKK